MHVAGLAVFDPSDDAAAASRSSGSRTSTPAGCTWRRRSGGASSRCPSGCTTRSGSRTPTSTSTGTSATSPCRRPGGRGELAELAAHLMALPLDRTRPLWEMWIIEGLEGGHVAVLTKVHHAAIDGASGNELTVALLDLSPEAAEPAPPEEPRGCPTGSRPTSSSLAYAGELAGPRSRCASPRRRGQTAEAGAVARGAATASPNVVAAARAVRRAAHLVQRGHHVAPRLRLPAAVAVDDVKAVKNALGGTVNDVVLALCAGALRRYLDERGEVPDGALVAMVPDLGPHRGPGRQRWATRCRRCSTSLATDVDDPVERLQAIQRGHEAGQGAAAADRRRHAPGLGRVRRAGGGRHGPRASTPAPASPTATARCSTSPSRTCRARRSRCTRPAPALVGPLPDGADLRRRRAEHDGDDATWTASTSGWWPAPTCSTIHGPWPTG